MISQYKASLEDMQLNQVCFTWYTITRDCYNHDTKQENDGTILLNTATKAASNVRDAKYLE